VIDARNLASMSRSGTSDPYCVLKSSFNKQHFKTKVQKKTLSPKWNETFKFFTSIPEGQIHLKMYDKDLFSKDECMGEVTISLQDFSDGSESEKFYTLTNEPVKKKKTKEQGEIRLKIWFSGPPGAEKNEKEKKPQKETVPKQTTTTKQDDPKTTTKDNQPKPSKEEPKPSKEESKPIKDTQPKNTNEKAEKKADKKKDTNKPISIEDKYELKKVIGKGAFSVVKEGIRKVSGKKYAVKCISKKLIDKKELGLLEREIDIMKKLQHPNIIQLMEVIDTPDTLYLVLEFASGGELFDAIVNKGSYSESDAAKIIKQILEAILHVHNHGIAHRDLKPENLLLVHGDNGDDIIKIADFGLSKDFGQEQLQTSCGTPDYVAPEVLLGEPYDMAVDIWSIGVISYVLLCGFPPFYGESQKELFENIMNGTYDFPDPEWTDVSEGAKDFIKKILIVDPEKRATAEECLHDEWVKEYTGIKKDLRRLESFSVKKFKEYTKKYKEQNPPPYISPDEQ